MGYSRICKNDYYLMSSLKYHHKIKAYKTFLNTIKNNYDFNIGVPRLHCLIEIFVNRNFIIHLLFIYTCYFILHYNINILCKYTNFFYMNFFYFWNSVVCHIMLKRIILIGMSVE